MHLKKSCRHYSPTLPDALAEIEKTVQIEHCIEWYRFVFRCAATHFETVAFDAGPCCVEILGLGTRGIIWALLPLPPDKPVPRQAPVAHNSPPDRLAGRWGDGMAFNGHEVTHGPTMALSGL